MSWAQVKAQLKTLEKDELIRLLHDLHDLNRGNQVFLWARLVAAPEDKATPYRDVIRQAYFPGRGTATLDFKAARKAISTFKKLDAGIEAEIDLLLFCAEMGIACAQQYPDIGSSLYNSIYDAYLDAARALQTVDDPSVTVALRPRFAKICEGIGDAGYGLYENLMDILLNYVQIDEDYET